MKLTDDEILSRIRGEITDSLGYGGEISKQREDAMLYYYGLPFGNEVEGNQSSSLRGWKCHHSRLTVGLNPYRRATLVTSARVTPPVIRRSTA